MTVGIDFTARTQGAVAGVGAVRDAFSTLRAEIAAGNHQIQSMTDLIERLKISAQGLPGAASGVGRGGIPGAPGAPGAPLPPGGAPPLPPGHPPPGAPVPPVPPGGRGLLDGLFPRTHGGLMGGVIGGLMQGNAGGVGGGMLGTLLGNMVMPGVGGVLGGIIGGQLGGKAQSAVDEGATREMRFLVALDGFSRRLDDGAQSFDDLERNVKNASAGLRVNYEDMLGAVSAYSAARGRSGLGAAADAIEGGRVALGYADSYGLDKDRTASGFGRMQMFSRDQQSPREFALMLGDVIAKSGQTALAGQITDSFTGAVERMVSATGGDVPNLVAMASLVAGLNGGGNPTLMGASGMSAIERANNAFMHGGGAGEPGYFFNMASLDMANPDLRSDPYKLKHLMEQGLFGSAASAHVGSGNATNLEAMLARFGIKPGMDAAGLPKVGTASIDALTRNLGLTGHGQTLDFLRGFVESGPGGLGASMALLDRAGVDRNSFPLTATGELSLLANGRRDEFMAKVKGDPRFSGMDPASMSDEQLVARLAAGGRAVNRGTEIANTRVDLENAITDLGSNFVELKTSIDLLRVAIADAAAGGTSGLLGNDFGSGRSGAAPLPPARFGQPMSRRFEAR